MKDKEVLQHESYESLCLKNKYLFGEIEKYTALIQCYKAQGLKTEELSTIRYRLKWQIEQNIDRMLAAREREMID